MADSVKKSKKLRAVLIVIGAVLAALVILGIIDGVRLRKSKMYTKPLVTLSTVTNEQEGYVDYYGIGYKMRYSIGIPEQLPDGSTAILERGRSARFYWLAIPIWGWAW